MDEIIYDIIITGGGPGGLTAGIYTSRDNLKTLLLEKGMCGGLPAVTDIIENYPGFPEGINGMELMQKFKKQAEKFGVKINEFEEVTKIEPSENKIKVKTNMSEYLSYAVIVSSGSVPKKLGIPGEEELKGKGISYCATCDGPLFKGRDIAVIGCGSSGLQEGQFLLNHVNSIKFVEFLPYMTAEKILQDRLKKSDKTSFLLNHQITAINGESQVESITVKDRETNREKKIDVSGVFIYIGFLPHSEFLTDAVKKDNYGYVITNDKMETATPGIYVIGDVRSKKVRQIANACGEAVVAAVNAIQYIEELKE